MKKNKPTIEAIVKVLNQAGWKFKKYKDGYCRDDGSFFKAYSERDLHKMYTKYLRKIGNHETKKFTKGKDRTAARDAIKTEKFDNIPSKKRVKEDNPWNYD